MGSAALVFALTAWSVAHGALALLVLAAVLLDAAVQLSKVIGVRTIYLLAPEARGRMNGLFISLMFASGAVASGLAPETLGFGAVCYAPARCVRWWRSASSPPSGALGVGPTCPPRRWPVQSTGSAQADPATGGARVPPVRFAGTAADELGEVSFGDADAVR
jgi:hypothetical protein